jgi:hypothetical protein
MLWIIQKSLYQEFNFNNLLNAIKNLNIEFKLVKLNANNVMFEIDENDTIINELNPNNLDKNIMICGGYKLSQIAIKNNWYPGIYQNENFNFNAWEKNWSKKNLLNGNAFIKKLKDITPEDFIMEKFFTRPLEDNKAFSGKVFERQFFFEWQKEILNQKDSQKLLVPDVELLISNIKKIYSETRFFVVNNEIITQSIYKLGNQVYFNEQVDEKVHNFAKKMIDRWTPHKAFVLDIAQTEEGEKIIEVNTINASGFYASDVTKLVYYLDNIDILKKETKKVLKY